MRDGEIGTENLVLRKCGAINWNRNLVLRKLFIVHNADDPPGYVLVFLNGKDGWDQELMVGYSVDGTQILRSTKGIWWKPEVMFSLFVPISKRDLRSCQEDRQKREKEEGKRGERRMWEQRGQHQSRRAQERYRLNAESITYYSYPIFDSCSEISTLPRVQRLLQRVWVDTYCSIGRESSFHVL